MSKNNDRYKENYTEIDIEELDEIESQLHQKHLELAQHEQELFKNLNEKYGDGNYDPATGDFTPTPKEETKE